MCLLTTSIAVAYEPAKQTVFLKFPNGVIPWHIANRSMTNQGYEVIMYPQGQDRSNRAEAITTKIIPYSAIPGISAQRLVRNESNDIRTYCKNVTTQVINQSSKSATYYTIGRECSGAEDQSLFSKAFNGEDAVYSVGYTTIRGKVHPNEFKIISNVIKNARLVANPNYSR